MRMDQRNFFYKLLYERNTFGCEPVSLYNSAKNNRYLLQRLCLEKKLDVHSGCVNTICWNSTGQYLLSGSDDLHLCITDAFTNEIKASIRTGHVTNIFSAKYLPNTGDSQVISCSGDGVIIYTDLNRPETATKNIFDCQEESVYDIATVPNDSHSFLTCSHDHTVRWYDLRVKSSCMKHPSYSRFARRQHKCNDDVLIRSNVPVTAIAVNSFLPWQLAIGCSDSIIRIYDRRMLTTKSLGGFSCDQDASVLAKFTYSGMKNANRITSLAYSRNCQQILASYSNDLLYLFDINNVRNTINTALDTDIIPDSGEKPSSCPIKRFRLRGDWSDTGPNALTTEELRTANTPASSSANRNASQASASNAALPHNPTPQQPQPTPNQSGSSSTASSNGNENRSNDARIRHLNTILSLILRNSFRGSSDSLQENNNQSSEEAPAASSAPTDGQSSSSIRSNDISMDSAANDPRVPSSASSSSSSSSSNSSTRQPAAESTNATAAASENNQSSNSAHNPHSFFIHIFGDDDYPFVARGYPEEDEDGNEEDFMDEDDDIDSDTTNDSVFNHYDSSSTFGNSSGRQRSRSSSSNDSSRRVRRRTRSIRSANRPRRIYEGTRQSDIDATLDSADENSREREKRLKTYKIRDFKTFSGHRNSRTVIKEATFWGDDYIVSGSDCGHIFFWSIEDQKLAMIMEGDHHVVNCLQPHPTDPILASSGIDYDIKIWSPRSEECKFDEKRAKKIMDRNKLLLEESRDTVTVPARFVLSLFSTLRNRQQQDRNQASGNNSRNDDSWVNNDSNMDDDDEVEL